MSIKFTVWPKRTQTVGYDRECEWPDFEDLCVDAPLVKNKKEMPLIKFGLFKDNKREGAGVYEITGIEADYDAEEMSIEEAVEALESAGVWAVVLPTATWTEAKPRWRVFCPLREPITLSKKDRREGTNSDLAAERTKWLFVLNGILGGDISRESAVLGQCYYYGYLDGGHREPVRLIEGERCLDDCKDLEEDAVPTASDNAGNDSTGLAHLEDLHLDDVLEDNTGEKKPLREWIKIMAEDGEKAKVRVQSLWRDSTSCACMIRFTQIMRPCVFDVGDYMTHHLVKSDWGESDEIVGRVRPMMSFSDAVEQLSIGDDIPAEKSMSMTYNEMKENLVHIITGNRYTFEFMPRLTLGYTEMRSMLDGNFTQTGARGRQAETFELWKQDPERKQVTSISFLPGRGRYIIGPDGDRCINTFSPLHRENTPEHIAELQAELFINHVKYLYGDRASDFLDWLAHIEQNPDILPHTYWLHISPHEGTGRSWMSSVLDRVWSPYSATGLDMGMMMESQFNQRLSGKLLAVVEEIKEGGRGTWKHHQRLKSWITEDMRIINAKNQPEFREFNRLRWLVFSNHMSAIPITADDRRCEVVICKEEPKCADYYKKLYHAREHKAFIQAVGSFLKHRDIRKFNPGKRAEDSEVKVQVISHTKSREERVMDIILEHWNQPVISGNALMGALSGEVMSMSIGREAGKLRSFIGQFEKLGRYRMTEGGKAREMSIYATPRYGGGDYKILCRQLLSRDADIFSRETGVKFASYHLDDSEL